MVSCIGFVGILAYFLILLWLKEGSMEYNLKMVFRYERNLVCVYTYIAALKNSKSQLPSVDTNTGDSFHN